MPVLLSAVRKTLADRLGFKEEEVVHYARCLRERGLLPAGKPGRGDDGSATVEIEHGLLLFLALMQGEKPAHAPDEVARFAALRSTGGSRLAPGDDGVTRVHGTSLPDGFSPTAWAHLLGSLNADRIGAFKRQLLALQFTRTPDDGRLLQAVTLNGVLSADFSSIEERPGECSLEFVDDKPPAWMVPPLDRAKLPRHRTLTVGADAFFALADLFGPIDAAAYPGFMSESRTPAIAQLYARLNDIRGGDGTSERSTLRRQVASDGAESWGAH